MSYSTDPQNLDLSNPTDYKYLIDINRGTYSAEHIRSMEIHLWGLENGLAHTCLAHGEPRTFHHFGRLPIELRKMIWKESLPGPREVRLLSHSSGPKRTIRVNKQSLLWLKVGDIAPLREPVSHLQTNSEARLLAKERYKLCFGNQLRFPVYIDSKTEYLLLSDMTSLLNFFTSIPDAAFERVDSPVLAIDSAGHGLGVFRRNIRSVDFDLCYAANKLGCFREIIVLKAKVPSSPYAINRSRVLGAIMPEVDFAADLRDACIKSKRVRTIGKVAEELNNDVETASYLVPKFTISTKEVLIDRLSENFVEEPVRPSERDYEPSMDYYEFYAGDVPSDSEQ